VIYSYKTNREVGKVLEEVSDCDFSIHDIGEVSLIGARDRIWFFPQALTKEEFEGLLDDGIRNFVLDTETDLERLLEVVNSNGGEKINISLRMKFQEHRIGSGKYFVYGMSSRKVNEWVSRLFDEEYVDKIGIHIHRKSQNTTEWEIIKELEDSLTEESFSAISHVNLGGGLPVMYKTYSVDVMPYIFAKLEESVAYLREKGIETYIEPGRFIAGPAVELETEIIQVYGDVIVLNCSIYNCALDSMITNIRMNVKGELDGGDSGAEYLIKGNTPTRDDIFRYKCKLRTPRVGDKIVFENAGAYNYFCDFCSLEKVKTTIL
jgi:ornithine decarboxylase